METRVHSARPAMIERGKLASAKRGKPFGIVEFVWRRGPLILGLGIPAFLILSVLIIPFARPVYKVEGSLMIKQTKEPTINGQQRESIQGDVGVFQRTLVLRLTDPAIIKGALENLPDDLRPRFLKELGDSDAAIYALTSRITAKEVERTYLIKVTMEAGEPKGLAATLYEVLASLIRQLGKEQEIQYASRLDYLRSERDKISTRLADEKKRILGIADRFENRSLLRADYSTDLGKMTLIQRLYWEAEALTLNKKADLEEAERNKKDLSEVSLEAFARERVADNFGINQIERWTYEKAQDLRASIDGLQTTNPDRRYVEERMKMMNDYMTSYKERVSEDTIKNLTEKREFELETAVIKARNAYEAAAESSERLNKELKTANEEATQISEGIFEANEITFSLGQLRDRLASIDNRIDDVELEAKSPLPVVIDRLPTPPSRPASNSASKLRLFVFVFSFGVVAGICLLFDFFDDRIRSRAELGAAVGGAGCEPLPFVTGAVENGVAKALREEPSSRATLAIRDIALRVVLEMERSGARFVAFAPACGNAGTTSLALEVARAVSAHGFNVLLSEFPGDVPGLAKAAGLPPVDPPPSPWGNKEEDPESAVELLPWNRAISADRARSSLNTFFQNARSAYDCVILDLAPPSESDISQEAIAKSDVVIVVARQEEATYRAVRSIVEFAECTGVPAVTAVLTFAKADTLSSGAGDLFRRSMMTVSTAHQMFRQRVSVAWTVFLARLANSTRLNAFREKAANRFRKKTAVPPDAADEEKKES